MKVSCWLWPFYQLPRLQLDVSSAKDPIANALEAKGAKRGLHLISVEAEKVQRCKRGGMGQTYGCL